MKQKDIAVIIVIIFLSGMLSYFISSSFLSPPENRQQSVEVVEAISPEFNVPDAKYFNANSVNPTKLIQIGPNGNNQPFADQ